MCRGRAVDSQNILMVKPRGQVSPSEIKVVSVLERSPDELSAIPEIVLQVPPSFPLGTLPPLISSRHPTFRL